MRFVALLSVIGFCAFAQPQTLELTLEPVAVQVNGKFTQHAGTFGTVTWRPRDRLGVQLTGGGNWLNIESSLNAELVEKYRVEAQWASSLLWTWGVFGALEVEPFAGEIGVFESSSVRLGLTLSVGAGLGGISSSRRPRRPPLSWTPAFASWAPSRSARASCLLTVSS